MEEKLEKFRELKRKREAASRLNHIEVLEEHKKAQLPSNWEKKREWAQKKIDEEEKRLKAEEQGRDYDRLKMLEIQADDADKWERKRESKKRPDPGFSDYAAGSIRQHDRLVRELKPDLEGYESLKKEIGEELFYATDTTPVQNIARKDSQQDIDRMVADVNKQIEHRNKHSRRRKFDDDADVDYINERNMRFNKKLERFYNKYTEEIKQNLERGTAI